MRICIGKDIFWIGLKATVSPLVEFLEVLEGGLELMSQEVSVHLNPAIDFDLQGLNEVSQVDLDPGLFDGCLDLGDFDLNLLEVGDFLVEEVQVRNELSAALQ